MNILQKFINGIDKLTDKTGAAISWLTTILVLVVCYDVFTRYFLNISSVALQELEWHIFALIFLLGASFTLRMDEHVRVDVLYSRFSEKGKACINIFGCLFFLIPFCLLIIFGSENFVINSFNIGETSPDPGGLPARYLLKAVIPVSFILLLSQAFSLLFKSFLTLLNREMDK